MMGKELFIENWNTQLKKGLLLFLVMNVIKKNNSYGYEIIQKIKEATGIEMADGTLYPILKKLKENKLALCKWEVNEEDAPRKYYYLTGTGNATLAEMKKNWSNLNADASRLIS